MPKRPEYRDRDQLTAEVLREVSDVFRDRAIQCRMSSDKNPSPVAEAFVVCSIVLDNMAGTLKSRADILDQP